MGSDLYDGPKWARDLAEERDQLQSELTAERRAHQQCQESAEAVAQDLETERRAHEQTRLYYAGWESRMDELAQQRDAARGDAEALRRVLNAAKHVCAGNKLKRQHARASRAEIDLAKAVDTALAGHAAGGEERALSDEEIEKRVRACLMDASNDDCWISATNGYAIMMLVQMVRTAIRDSRPIEPNAP